MSKSKILKVFAISAASILLVSSVAHAGSPNGKWRRSNGAIIKVFNCGGGLGMRVVKSPSPKKVGKTIMCGAKKSGNNKWQGSLLNLDDGKRYSGYVKLTGGGSRLTLSGCVLGGLVCKSDAWSRAR